MYVTVVRAKKRCPTVVLVVAPDAEVAAWAAQPIDLGLGFGTLQPVLLGPASVPKPHRCEDLQVTSLARSTEPEQVSACKCVTQDGARGPAPSETSSESRVCVGS